MNFAVELEKYFDPAMQKLSIIHLKLPHFDPIMQKRQRETPSLEYDKLLDIAKGDKEQRKMCVYCKAQFFGKRLRRQNAMDVSHCLRGEKKANGKPTPNTSAGNGSEQDRSE